MKDVPLLTITKIIDSETSEGVADVGNLDYRVHCQELENWLAAGAGRRDPQSVRERQKLFATELRSLADAIENGSNPFTVTVEYAEKEAAKRREQVAEWIRKNEARSVP